MFGGQPLVSAIGLGGTPAQVPAGYRVVDRNDAIEDFVRPLRVTHAAFTFMSVLLWIVAALIIGSVVYLSAPERTRDFAVFKAVGVSTRSVLGGLVLQAVLVAILAAVVAGLLSLVLAPFFPMRAVVPGWACGAGGRRAGRRAFGQCGGTAARGVGGSRARVRRCLSRGRSEHPEPYRRVLERWVYGPPDRRPEP
jgi:hypothetical protein